MASKEAWLSYFNLLEKLSITLGELAEIENNKATAVTKGDLTTIDEIMKQEQAYALTLRGYEQKRMNLLASLQVPPSTLSELHLYMPKEMVSEGKRIVEQVKKMYARYKEAADLALGYLEAGLKQMENFTGEQSDYKPRAPKDMPPKEREIGREPFGKVEVPDLLEDRVLSSREVLATRIRTSENVAPPERPMGSSMAVGSGVVAPSGTIQKLVIETPEEPVVRGVPDTAGSVRARVGTPPEGKNSGTASKNVRERMLEAAKQTALEEQKAEKASRVGKARPVPTEGEVKGKPKGVPSREELMARVEAAAKAKVEKEASKTAPPVKETKEAKKQLSPEEIAMAEEKKALEEEKKAIEIQRKATEQAKKLIEQRKKAIEQEKKAAEQARKKAEDAKKAEEARLARDTARKEAEELRRIQREEKKTAEQEKKALKQEKKAIEHEKRAIEQEKKALEQQRKALEQEKKALEQLEREELALEEAEANGDVLESDVASLEATVAPVKEKGKSLLSQFMKKKKSKLEEEKVKKEEALEDDSEKLDPTEVGRLQQPASGKVPPSKEQLKKQKAKENEKPNVRNSSFKG